ncbi:MAG: SusC/RagA family TonB-linked outer membrane protein, partial [Sphingobacteriaceae bacterium]
NEKVTTVLDQILTGSGSTYRLLANNLIVITSKEKQAFFVKITGKVIDENGQPLPGASVKLKDTKIGTVTDVNGLFSIEAPDQSVLIVSFIGYANREIVVSGTAPLSISMVPTGKNLNEVVVVGYGTQKKVN